MRRREAWAIVLVAGAVYAASAAAIDPLCLALSPVPVILFFIYPYLKRLTAFVHLGLGLAWSMAPLGGWLAASRSLSTFSDVLWLWLFSILWVAGFDIIYATLDEAFDRRAGLHSLPVRLGTRPALKVAALVHAAAFASLCVLWFKQLHSDVALWWLGVIAALFVWQHVIAERRPEFAFFQLNGILGFLVFGFIAGGAL
jgi:4-hydroxybenzoate polyprenyltransferase